MRFQVLEFAIELASILRQPADVIRRRDPELHRQLRGAANSIGLNIAEGASRSGRDRSYHFRIAAGSAREARTALRLAAAWNDLPPEAIEPALGLIDRILAMLWPMTR
jgi:four helix bundle protein